MKNSFIKKSKKDIENDLIREFVLAENNDKFVKLCSKLNAPKEVLMKNTSKLEHTLSELDNCSKCKNLENCKNEVLGHVIYPEVKYGNIEYIYKPCKKFKEQKDKNNTKFFETPKVLKEASLSDIVAEKERNEILKYIKDFLKKKINNEKVKGLYLSGSFGSGKSYILSALLNELSLKNFNVINVNYPFLLRKMKSSFSDNSFDDILDEIMNCDILLLDDIGAENITQWSNDILITLLDYRMNNELTTFFTSNYTTEELSQKLSQTSKGIDEICAHRIIERIKSLSTELALISSNKRK